MHKINVATVEQAVVNSGVPEHSGYDSVTFDRAYPYFQVSTCAAIVVEQPSDYHRILVALTQISPSEAQRLAEIGRYETSGDRIVYFFPDTIFEGPICRFDEAER